MAITRVAVTNGAGSSTVDGTNFTTTSMSGVTPGRLLVSIWGYAITASPPDTGVLTGGGVTWVDLGSVLYNSIASPTYRLHAFAALSDGWSDGSLTLTCTNTHIGWMYSTEELDGVDLTGGVAGALAQAIATNRSNGATALTITLGSAPAAASYVLAAFGALMTGAATFSVSDGEATIIRNPTAITTPYMRHIVTAKTGGGAACSVSETGAGANAMGGLALEFKASGTVVGTSTALRQGRRRRR